MHASFSGVGPVSQSGPSGPTKRSLSPLFLACSMLTTHAATHLWRLAHRTQPRRGEVVELRTLQRPLAGVVRLVHERALEAFEIACKKNEKICASHPRMF